ncbi:uncharacterized protein LOC132197169 [Neocloeon triangulifer]|uniref:uncharacterized protein LOC132197169 n=1 Tax=Neocloeon triangulifer TaxID=2078957 RepID=UPI00286EB58D|nr:uncharacterized protein LOC132197169 [Neocloeon triangulifer]
MLYPRLRNILFVNKKLAQLCLCNFSSKDQPARFMMKLMKGSKNPKWKMLREIEKAQSKSLIFSGMKCSFTQLQGSPQGNVSYRRQGVLNSVFTRHIADHMSMSHLQGFDIQLTNVKVASDLSQVKAFWISRTCMTGHDLSLQMELDKYSPQLRRDLSDIKVIGSVPPIIFVPDKILAQGAAIDLLLQTAEKSEELSTEFNTEEDLPPMRQDLLGLNRELIMTKVAKKCIKQSSHPKQGVIVDTVDTIENLNSAIEEFKKLQKKSLTEKKYQEKKLKDIDFDVYFDVFEIRNVTSSTDDIEDNVNELPDFINDDDNFKN